jgi:ParB-like chromosome segregation protein Spo0J
MRFGEQRKSHSSSRGKKGGDRTNARRPKAGRGRLTASSSLAPAIKTAAQRVIQNIEIGKIKVKDGRRPLNPERLRRLVNSIRKLGMHHPVTVQGAGFNPIYLVAGLHRLEAAKQLGWQTIPCEFPKGGEKVARLWEISENLDRSELTPLERDRLIAEWVRLTEGNNSDSNEEVTKKTTGRPTGGIAKAARGLPVKGATEEAKRKAVVRALQVDKILPNAEKAAKAAGLDKNQTLLPKIAKEKTLEAQIKKIAELAAAQKAKAARESGADNEVTFKQLKTEWTEGGKLRRRAWDKATAKDQDRFIDEVLPRKDDGDGD